MKKIIVFLFVCIFSFSAFSDSSSAYLYTKRIQGLAIGEITLGYRLIALSASLSIANAVETSVLQGLLENIDSTLLNGKKFVSTDTSSVPLNKQILNLMDALLDCSSSVKQYSKTKNYDSLGKVRSCIDSLEGQINKISEQFNDENIKNDKPVTEEKKLP